MKEGTRFSATINYITIMGQIELKHKELSVIKSDKENIIYAAQYQHELLWE
ncbi:hypothetical protein FACS189496_2750 [Bacilli bacterium]|nr:hypothetical protein FACS189496_2750 [Bacilli bacterium]